MGLPELFNTSSVCRIFLGDIPITFVRRIMNGDDGFYCAAVLSGLGYAHDVCLAPDGREHPIPPGTAHLIEHALTSSHLVEHGYPVDRSGSLSIRTGTDRMTWGVANAYARPDAPNDEIAATVAHLLGMVVDPVTEATLEAQIRHEDSVIEVERAGRRQQLSYRLQLAMMDGLYPGVNLGSDPFGPIDFTASATSADLVAALNVVQHDIRAITVVGPVTESLIETVLARVEPLCLLVSRSRWTAAARHPFARTPVALSLVPAKSPELNSAIAVVGVRLPGLIDSVADRRERAARFLLTEVLADRLSMQSSATARTLARMATVDPPWLEAEDAEELVMTHVDTTSRMLQRLRPPVIEMGLLELIETMVSVLRLAHRADIHDLTLAEVFEVAETLDTDGLGYVAAELQEAQGAVAYCGPPLG